MEAELKGGSTAEGQMDQPGVYLVLEARLYPASLYSIPANLTEAALGLPLLLPPTLTPQQGQFHPGARIGAYDTPLWTLSLF